MKLHMYNAGDALNIATNYLATAALAGGAVMLGNGWTIAIGAGLSAALMTVSLKYAREFLESSLEQHPPSHIYSPNLRHMVENLYKVSGLDMGKHPVYDFKPKALTDTEEDQSTIKKALHAAFRKAALTPNAAAANYTKPVIIISEPLLELLEDDEEYAVLAHEFVHAAAKHQKVALPLHFIASAAQLSNMSNYLAQGALNSTRSIGAYIFGSIMASRLYKKRVLDNAPIPKAVPKSAEEYAAQKKWKSRSKLASLAAGTAAATAVYPPFLPLIASVMTMNRSLTLVAKKMSRDMEFMADRDAVTKLGANPLRLMTSLRKMEALLERSQKNELGYALSEIESGTLEKICKTLHATHPPTEVRVKHLARLARKKGFNAEEIHEAAHGPVEIGDVRDLPVDIIQAIVMQFHLHDQCAPEPGL